MKKSSLFLKKIYIIAVAILILAGMTSCKMFEVLEMPSNNSGNSPSDKNEAVQPVNGGDLTIAATKPDTLNPILTNNYYIDEVLGLIYDTLFTFDNNMKAVPSLVDSYNTSVDGITWSFKLKENIFWHDNKYFSAEDVVHTINMLMALPDNRYYHCVQNIESIKVEGAYIFVIKCKTPDSFLNEKLYFPVLPKHVDVTNAPVGTGLFKFNFITDNNMKLVKAILNTENLGRKTPYIETVTVEFFETTREAIFSDCDIVMTKYGEYPQIEGKIGYSVKKYIAAEYEVLAVNTAKDVLSDSSIRRAIAYAIDRNGAVAAFSNSRALINDCPILPESWLRPKGEITFTYNPSLSKELINKSGKSNLQFDLLVNSANAERVSYAEYFKEKLAEVGITINVIQETAEVIGQKLESKEYDLLLTGINVAAPYELKSFYSSNVPHNISGYSNSILDGHFSKFDGYIYENERKRIFSDIEEILLADVPMIGLFYKQNFIFYNNSRVYGITESKPTYTKKFANIENWYVVNSAEG